MHENSILKDSMVSCVFNEKLKPMNYEDYTFKIPSLAIKKTKPTIYYVGQYGTSGYATAAKGYIYRYFINGYDITWHPLKFDNSTLSKDSIYNTVAESTINNHYSNYDFYIYHSTPDLWKEFNEKFNANPKNKNVVGYTTWETNELPESWVDCINNQVSEVCCPSNYNLETFKNSGVTVPIRVVPHVFLDNKLMDKKDVFLYDSNGHLLQSDDIYTFYTLGELNERKGIADVINTFCNTFTKEDKVRLIIKVHYKNYNTDNKKFCLDSIQKIINKYNNSPDIYCFVNNLTDKEITALHSIGDCYVSLTKSEGFGLTIFDAFTYGKKIIATGYSGHLDYLGKNYNGLVRYKLDTVKNMEDFSRFYSEDTIWAYPDLTHAKELMKGIVNK